jgi:hypothetical protein
MKRSIKKAQLSKFIYFPDIAYCLFLMFAGDSKRTIAGSTNLNNHDNRAFIWND